MQSVNQDDNVMSKCFEIALVVHRTTVLGYIDLQEII